MQATIIAAFFVLLGLTFPGRTGAADSAALVPLQTSERNITTCTSDSAKTVYDFDVETLDGKTVRLDEFKGKPLIIVNVATYCAFTRQYLDFNPLLEKYKYAGLGLAAFPCNQFMMQEPGANNELLNGLKYVRPGGGWEPHQSLKVYGKIDVNGEETHPLYSFLKDSCPQTDDVLFPREKAFWSPVSARDITWNFDKFLIDGSGRPRFRVNKETWQNGAAVEPLLLQLISEASTSNATAPGTLNNPVIRVLSAAGGNK